ncbi:hypothetical protein EJB05_14190, partial [Eragrostis curvula]
MARARELRLRCCSAVDLIYSPAWMRRARRRALRPARRQAGNSSEESTGAASQSIFGAGWLNLESECHSIGPSHVQAICKLQVRTQFQELIEWIHQFVDHMDQSTSPNQSSWHQHVRNVSGLSSMIKLIAC